MARLGIVVKDGLVLDVDVVECINFPNNLFFLLANCSVWIKYVGQEMRLRSSVRCPSFVPTASWVHPSI